jgi:predicted enzyme related to lactoylglutathione lyase
MANHHGDFTWYELITPDPAAAAAFYGPMLGWTIRDSGTPGMDYRLAATAESDVAGIMATPSDAEMPPAWLGYVTVDDVDAMTKSFVDGGGAVFMDPFDVPGVGRMAFLADPQGAMLYVMKGSEDGESLSFSYDKPRPGHCAWNELATSDPAAAILFYGQSFGWVKDGEMDMGPMGSYAFLRHAGRAPDGAPMGAGMIGALYPKVPEDPQSHWLYYFRVADIDAAVDCIASHGGALHLPPTEIPGGDFSLIGVDPQGAYFGLVGARR